MQNRLIKLRQKMAEKDLDAILISSMTNQYYLSNYNGGGIFIISKDEAWISTDSRFYEEVKRTAKGFKLFEAGYDGSRGIVEFANQFKPKVIGFEEGVISLSQYKEWKKVANKCGFKLKPAGGLVETMRAIKEPGELETIKKAVALTDASFTHLCSVIKEGMTEAEASWIIESYMRIHGAERIAFDLIIATGQNGALPHAIPGDRPFKRGEPIILDIGARINGYNSDMTRTICLGQPNEKFWDVYNTVLKAQETAVKKCKPGMKTNKVDKFARDIINNKNAEWGKSFGHGLGHGVGLNIHERPGLRWSIKDVLLPGMVITIEPGIYLPDWGGVRIEDTCYITEDGVEVLTQSTKDPVVKI